MGFVEDFVFDPYVPKVTEESMNEANAVLDKPFNFFSSYLQLAQYKKSDILKSVTIKKLSQIIAQMRIDKQSVLDEREAILNVSQMNFDMAQRDADRIKELDAEIKHLNKQAVLNAKMVKAEKKELWMDMHKKLVAMEKEYNQYKTKTAA